jgi:hypothetical protein
MEGFCTEGVSLFLSWGSAARPLPFMRSIFRIRHARRVKGQRRFVNTARWVSIYFQHQKELASSVIPAKAGIHPGGVAYGL